MSETEKNLETIKEKLLNNPRHLSIVKGKEEEYRKAVMIDNYARNDAVKLLLEELENRIKGINHLLMSHRNLSDKERDQLFERKNCFNWLLRFFKPNQETIKQIDEFAKRNVEHLKDF